MVLVRYRRIPLFLYEKKNQMDSNLIQEIINGQEPIAIIKYYEWRIFSNDYTYARHTILRVDTKHNDIPKSTFRIMKFSLQTAKQAALRRF